MKNLMTLLVKAVLFYTTVVVGILWVCSGNHLCLAWLCLAFIVLILSIVCIEYITLRDLIKITGYETWYKYLRN